MTTTARNATQSRRPAPVRGASRRPGSKRSAGLITFAALLVVGFGLATGIAVTRAGEKTDVVTVATAVPKGQVVERRDLTTHAVSGVSGAIPADRLEQLVGSTAAVDLIEDQVVVEEMLTDAALPAQGGALVGFALDASRIPASGLSVGDRVRVVAVPADQNGDADSVDLDSPPVLTGNAFVHSIHGDAGAGAIEVTLVVDDKDANRVAAYGTAGRVAVVEISVGEVN